MDDSIFREYDIRGEVNGELVLDEVYALTQAIVYYFLQHDPTIKTIAIGMDGRTHSPIIKEHMCRAMTDSGLDVVFLGVCPSPALYFALHTLPVDGGLMITASHNPKEFNGIKVCLGKKVIWGTELQKICELYKAGKKRESIEKGEVSDQPIVPPYVDWLVDHFEHLKNMPLSVVIDCGNGAAGAVMPTLVEKMQWSNVQLLYPEVDGTFPNHEADPTVEKNMMDVKRILQTTDVAIGLGLDGDGDRMSPMTKAGKLVSGDQLLALFAQPIVQRYPGAAVVFDIKSSAGLIELLERWGAQPCMSPSGHAIIKDQMKKHAALLGGEISCHFFFNDRYFGYDDGIYAALRLFELLQESGQTLDELLAVFPKKYSTREFRIACPDNKKSAIVQQLKKALAAKKEVQLITIDGVRASMPYGWGIVRASNTQPALSIRFEADSWNDLQRVKQDFIELLQPHLDIDLLQAFSS